MKKQILKTIYVVTFMAAFVFFGAASLFFGLGLILLSVARICPFAASFVYRLFSKDKE